MKQEPFWTYLKTNCRKGYLWTCIKYDFFSKFYTAYAFSFRETTKCADHSFWVEFRGIEMSQIYQVKVCYFICNRCKNWILYYLFNLFERFVAENMYILTIMKLWLHIQNVKKYIQ